MEFNQWTIQKLSHLILQHAIIAIIPIFHLMTLKNRIVTEILSVRARFEVNLCLMSNPLLLFTTAILLKRNGSHQCIYCEFFQEMQADNGCSLL